MASQMSKEDIKKVEEYTGLSESQLDLMWEELKKMGHTKVIMFDKHGLGWRNINYGAARDMQRQYMIMQGEIKEDE